MDQKPPAHPHSGHQIAACAAAFCLSLGAGLWLARSVLPAWGGEVERAKMAHFLEHRDEYDTVVIGPSSTHSGFDPIQFDLLNAEAGVPTRTFNFGIAASHTFSHELLLKQILAAQPRKLRWVLIQSEGVHESTLSRWKALTPQMVAWHDWSATQEVCELFEHQGVEDLWRARREHWTAFAYRTLTVSRGLPWVEALLGLSRPGQDMGLDREGFMPLVESKNPQLTRRRQLFLQRQGAYIETIQEWMEEEPQDIQAAPVLLQKIARMRDLCVEAGVEAVFLTVAGSHRESPAVAARALGFIPYLLRYDDVRAYSELFHPANRFDWSHFSPAGAFLFTSALASDFQELVREAR